jgi:drug/metabolite transporter (DMT)-like permease
MMKNTLRKLFSPILNIFEAGDEPYLAKPLNRKILIAMGLLFTALVSVVIYFSIQQGELGYAIPAVVFSTISLVTLVVGFLGNDRAVAKIWGNR